MVAPHYGVCVIVANHKPAYAGHR